MSYNFNGALVKPPLKLRHGLVIKCHRKQYIDGLVQDCSNSIANAMESPQSCTKPSTCNYLSMSSGDCTTHLIYSCSWPPGKTWSPFHRAEPPGLVLLLRLYNDVALSNGCLYKPGHQRNIPDYDHIRHWYIVQTASDRIWHSSSGSPHSRDTGPRRTRLSSIALCLKWKEVEY